MTLSLTFTHKTDLKETSSFTVLGGDVVVCGRAGRGPWAYYTYSKQYNESHAPKHVIKVMTTVADPGFPRWGRQPGEYANVLFGQISAEN